MELDRSIVAGVSAFAVGAGLMYALDPGHGRARRARLRDKLVRAEHGLAIAGRSGIHDLRNRGRGFAHGLAGLTHRDQADDDVILARVQSRLGRAIPHPGGIGVSVRGGIVTLQGPVLHDELERLVHEIRHVQGVVGIHNKLDVRDAAGRSAWLQGEPIVTRRPFRFRPGSRLLLAAGVGALLLGRVIYGLSRR
jgi:hypothetical protein